MIWVTKEPPPALKPSVPFQVKRWSRLRAAWLVLIGKADAVVWE